ncbi:MAG TPA: TPM domain-containing protein [Kofleriaceae bacterium]|nr:TPM domain-containing protein [Kofleriaceae bacterium]
MYAALLLAVSVAVAATPLPPRGDRLIYDEAGVLDDATERRLEARHRELLARAGVAIVVITVPALVDETIDDLAVRVGQTWGVGRRGQDRGLVVALARDDRQIFVATGYGTEGYLPDGRVGGLLDEHAIPLLREGRPSEALARLSDALVDASAREYGVTLGAPAASAGSAAEPAARTGCSAGSVVLLVLAGAGFLLLARRHPVLAMMMLASMSRGRGGFGRGGFGGGGGIGGFGGGGFGGGGAGRGY